MTLREPATFATDLLLAAATAWWGWQLLSGATAGGGRSRRWWGIGFCASAGGALCGGLYHALGDQAAAWLSVVLWKTTVASIGLAGACLFSGAARAVLPRPLLGYALLCVWLKYVLYLWWMSGHDAFRYVVYDYAPLLLAILALQFYDGVRRREGRAVLIGAGILLSFAAAAIQVLKLAPHRHFNHNDLYHVVQLAAFWFLYRGGMELRDRG